MTDKQLMQDAYDALCVAFAGRQGVAEWEQNETLRAALRERLAQPIASGQAPPLLGRVELQREAKHPAPCASHCEAPAFKIEIRQLKTQIEVNRAQPMPATKADMTIFAAKLQTLLMCWSVRFWRGRNDRNCDH